MRRKQGRHVCALRFSRVPFSLQCEVKISNFIANQCRSPSAWCEVLLHSVHSVIAPFVDHSELHFCNLHVPFYSQGVVKQYLPIWFIHPEIPTLSNVLLKGASIDKAYFNVDCRFSFASSMISCGRTRKRPPAVFGNPEMALRPGLGASFRLCLLIFS